MQEPKICKCCGLAQLYTRLITTERGVQTAYYDFIDACIWPIVRALQDGKVETIECCCGHGEKEGVVFLADGRVLRIERPTYERPTTQDPRVEVEGQGRPADRGD